MLTRLDIENLRAFSRFRLEGLTRVNLLVGKNGCGKTTVLEAVALLAGNGSPRPVWQALSQRSGDWMRVDSPSTDRDRPPLELFHDLPEDREATLRVTGEGDVQWAVEFSMRELASDLVKADSYTGHPLLWRPAADSYPFARRRRVLVCLGDEQHAAVILELNKSGRLAVTQLLDEDAGNRDQLGANLIPCSGISEQALGDWFSQMVLTPLESKVTEVLRILRPDLERLVWIPATDSTAAGFYLSLAGQSGRLPLELFGEGLRRLLGIAIRLVESQSSILLIDEIDTGLHHSVLEQLWRALVQLCRQMDVQIFATTHSGDCVRSLAWMVEDDPSFGPDVSLHRIDPALDSSVRYGAEEIALAARHHVEVRG